ncbi:MAG TPA: TrkA family potassium uptake protein [Acidimicrobiales bacterium]|nr:TrkA family potassium uptake protein [Acidimicrobiales bacterium]
MNAWRRVRLGFGLVGIVVAIGTAGYVALGLDPLEALYQTVTTVTTVGFREVGGDFGPGKQTFTIGLILSGVGTMLYTLTTLLEALVEGHLGREFERRRMDRKIDALRDHVIVCGWGRVGRALAEQLHASGEEIVVIDNDPERAADVPFPRVEGDATEDDTLRAAGIERARALVAALNADADNLFVVVAGRALRPDIFIVARVRTVSAEEKLRRGGADRVVNPQQIGGHRMGAFVLQPHVAEFLDVVMHDQSMEFRLEEVIVPDGSPLAGRTLRETQIRDRTGALVLAMRAKDGSFRTNPDPGMTVDPGEVLISIGTEPQLAELRRLLRGGR